MANHAILVSNNPEYSCCSTGKADLRFIDGSALDVLIAGRDLAHQGWLLANHPLYGNFRPYQQPYRSLLLLPPHCATTHDAMANLAFLEEALQLYQGPVRKISPQDVPEHMRKDCALLDRELLRATLESLY